MAAFALVIILAIFVPFTACGDDNEMSRPSTVAYDAFGALTAEQLCDVVTNADMDEIVMEYEGFTVSFNPTFHMPNWVAWTLTRDKVENGTVSRKDNFRPDSRVPGCATLDDYYRSGFDRGHMAPAGDMKWSANAMDESFYLTNICPQLHALNDGAWKKLEEKCRGNAKRDSLLIIISGPVLNQGFEQYIGKTPVPVPSQFFKVILTPSVNGGKPQAIGFLMPNSYVEGGMQRTAVSVDEIEKLTGHDFFHLLDDDVEADLESANDFNRFSTGIASRRQR